MIEANEPQLLNGVAAPLTILMLFEEQKYDEFIQLILVTEPSDHSASF